MSLPVTYWEQQLVVLVDFCETHDPMSTWTASPNALVVIGAFKRKCGTTCGALQYFTERSALVALIRGSVVIKSQLEIEDVEGGNLLQWSAAYGYARRFYPWDTCCFVWCWGMLRTGGADWGRCPFTRSRGGVTVVLLHRLSVLENFTSFRVWDCWVILVGSWN